MSSPALGIGEIVAGVRERRFSARELVDASLARCTSDALGCFYRVDESGARAAADAVDAKVARGEDAGPLAGVPVALKDLFVTRGVETTAGSKILSGWVPPYDGTAVKRLRDAGAIVVGKASMDEFAMGSSTENSAFGPARNPWDPSRVPGGSSGGSAAAVAARLVAGALGTDTGGSIRQPAALSGVTGLKPTYGRVSRHGMVAFASSLDQAGPFGRSAVDCAHLLQAIAGHDARDATSLDHAVPDYVAACQNSIRNLTIGIPNEYFAQTPSHIVAPVMNAISQLEKLGARTVDIHLPHTDYGIAAYYIIATAEASSNLARYDGIRYGLRAPSENLNTMYSKTRAAGFGPEVRRRIMLGTYALRSGYYDAYYLRAQKVRTLIKNDFDSAFSKCQIIATPTTPNTAFKIGEKADDPLSMYLADVFTVPCSLAGLPGMSLPCGFHEGLPVGLQLLAPALREEALFAVAGEYQRVTDWHTRTPPGIA